MELRFITERGISPIIMAWRLLELHLAVATAISVLILVHGITDPRDGTLLSHMLIFLLKVTTVVERLP